MRNPTAPSAKLQFGWIGNRFAMGWVDGNVGLISEPQTSCSPSGSRAANSRTTGEFQLIGQSLDRGGRGGHHIKRTLEMRLNKKVAVVHGAGGAVGSTVAQTFANEGAMVFLAGRNPASAEAAASRIRLNGGALNWRKASQESL